MEYQKTIDERKSRKKAELEAQERKNLQFRPQTSIISNKIANQKKKNGQINKFQELFEESKKRKNTEKIPGTSSECTFKPKLTKFNPGLYKTQKLENNKKEESTKIENSEKQKNLPKSINPIKIAERKGNKSVGEYLHEVSKTHKEKLQKKKEEQIEKFKEDANKKFTRGKSELILEKRKNEHISLIFNTLDGDNDNFIDSNNINIESIF